MSCGCSSVHTPPTITSCNATYNVCTGKSFYINVIGCADPIVTIPTQSDIGYPIVGLLEYSEINKKIYYTHNGSNSGVATTDSFTYTVVCNGISRTCTITVNIDDSISIDTTVVELDGCCIPTYTAKVYGSTVYSVIVDNTNILNTSYTSDAALSTFLNTYINVNGTFTVTKTTVSDVVNWTIVLTSNTKVLNSVTGISLVQAIKTLCGCKLGDVEYTWTIPDCATLVPGYSVHDCKIQVIVPLYDALDDTCCPIDLTVRCGNCTSNCEKTETYNWCPPIYENCTTPDCTLYPCTSYNPISGNCDDICDECDTCCQNESGYYCAECCDNNGCALANCPETSQPVCVGQECVCYLDGVEVDPLPNGCCPNCTDLTVLPNCHTCVNGIIVAPDTTCPTNTTYNYTTCQCDCDCINGYCYNVLTQICEPCPECVTIAGLYTCNGQPYTTSLVPCTQCINNVIVPNTCASGSIPNPYFNPNNPVSTTNPCCISLTPCDCDNPTCVGQGTICTHIEGSEECYCVDCTSLSCTNTSVICEEVNGCDCVGNTCVSGCPTCTGTVSIQEYCSPFFVKYEGCNNNNDKYRFKVYEVNNLLEKPITGCTYDDYLNIPLSGLTDITNSLLPADLQYNTSSSVFFIDGTLSSNYLVIDKLGVQTMLIKVKKYGIETIYEFVIDGNTCILASEENSDTDLVTPANPRIFRETCKFIYGLKSTGVCPFNDYEWDFEVTEDTDTAIEIQDGKYIVIFPPDFPLGTTREVCVTGKYIYEEVVCYSKEACKDYTPCTGGCGCNPCTDPNSGLQTSIETITDAINGTITASASVLINCNGTLGGVLALCEAANSSENCSPLDNVNNYGTSPLPFSAYDDFNGTPCSLWNCNESDPTGCGTEGQAPCGWLYDDTKLVVDNYNEATIKVSFVDGEVKGKLCWAAKYECGYVCNCIEVDKVINCEDYGITDVSINCTPTPTSTNVGQLIISVNNYSDPYKIEVYKQGTPNTLLGTYPPLPATSIVTSPYTITIPESWGISNGDELIIKVIMLVDGLDCDYEESIVYNCCITPTIGDLSVLCNNNTGEITTITFTTNTAGNPYNIYINGSTTSVYSGITIVGTNTYIFNQGMPNVTNIKVVICDDNTTDCCAESSINVVCDKNCTITGADIVITCVNGDITSVEIEGSTGTLSDTYTIVVTNTSNIAPNTVTKSNQTLPYTLTGGELATLAISDGDIITAVITVTGEPTCTITVIETVDCSVDCNLVVGIPSQNCNDIILESISIPIVNGAYPITVTGSIIFDDNGATLPTPIPVPINDTIISGNYLLEYVGNPESRNCMSGTLTFTDANDCQEEIIITCVSCAGDNVNTWDCISGDCVKSLNNTGIYDNQASCKSSCSNISLINCGDTYTVSKPISSNSNNNKSYMLFNLEGLVNNDTVYLEVAFGGKPEKYTIRQEDDNNVKTDILVSPYLGCNCAVLNPPKSLNGFWSNVSGLTQSGLYNTGSVASCTNPFVFPITATSYGTLDYSTYISGSIGSGTTYNFIPDDSTWIDHYTSNCAVNSSRDYDTCGTCTTNTFEAINAKALSRIYFKYLAAYGNTLEIEVEHGILGDSCNSGSHGIKFKLVCPTNITTKYNCVNNTCVEDINGIYDSLSECELAGCIDVTTSYNCVNNECVEATGGDFATLQSCLGSGCEIAAIRYSCTNNNCIEDASGEYLSMLSCEQSCVSILCESTISQTSITDDEGIVQNPNRYYYHQTPQ